jgi:8-oxo-dGTP diphosphatase
VKEVAVGILTRDGHVLACQRRRDAPYPLKWEFPGGKIESGEKPEDSLCRELKEELGIDVLAFHEFFRQEWIYSEGVSDPGRDGTFRVYYYLISTFSGTPVNNNVFEQILWVIPADLQSMDILEGNREAVARLVENGDTIAGPATA